MYYVSLNLKHNLIIFNCRKSATCAHVSGLLHALVSLAPAQFQATPSTTDDVESPLPITSYTCNWKVPKKRKEQHENVGGPVLKNMSMITNAKRI